MTTKRSKTDDWTEEQARKIGEATELSVRESGADVGASVRAESTAVHENDRVEKIAIPPEKKPPIDPHRHGKHSRVGKH